VKTCLETDYCRVVSPCRLFKLSLENAHLSIAVRAIQTSATPGSSAAARKMGGRFL